MAETVAQYLHKGDQVTVSGDLSMRTYADREGQNRTALQISASQVAVCGAAAPVAAGVLSSG